MDAARKILQYLRSKGITQRYLGRKAGIDAAALSMSLNGKRKFTLDEYEAICWALGVNVDTFLEPKPPEKAS